MSSHLRLVPKPLAKASAPRPYPLFPDGAHLFKDGNSYRFVHAANGRIVETVLTADDLIRLHVQMERLGVV